MSTLDKIKKFEKIYFNKNGYLDCYNEIKSIISAKPSLWQINFMFIIKFEEFCSNDIDFIVGVAPSKLDIIISECKYNNKFHEFVKNNNILIWDNKEYFNQLVTVLKFYIALKDTKYESFNDLEQKYLSYAYKVEYTNKLKEEKIIDENKKFPLLDDVIGLDIAKEIVLERVIKPSKHKSVYQKYNVKLGGGILLYGLPGTGKTMFAQAVANEIDAFFIEVKSSDIKSKFYGETENKIKEVFSQARKYDVSIIFFDEFESIGVSRDRHGSEITAGTVVPELLSQMQGFKENENIILVIAATNRPWDIDSALLRPGRFDSLVYVELPNFDARYYMFKNYLKHIKIKDEYLKLLAEKTDNFNGSDIKNICDSIIRVVIDYEIKLDHDYELNLKDIENILDKSNSSVRIEDVTRMREFNLSYLK